MVLTLFPENDKNREVFLIFDNIIKKKGEYKMSVKPPKGLVTYQKFDAKSQKLIAGLVDSVAKSKGSVFLFNEKYSLEHVVPCVAQHHFKDCSGWKYVFHIGNKKFEVMIPKRHLWDNPEVQNHTNQPGGLCFFWTVQHVTIDHYYMDIQRVLYPACPPKDIHVEESYPKQGSVFIDPRLVSRFQLISFWIVLDYIIREGGVVTFEIPEDIRKQLKRR